MIGYAVRRSLKLSLAIVGGLALMAGAAQAQYPQQTITLYTTGAGGPSDIVARLIAPLIGESLGQTVVVQNRTANQLVEELAKAAPDGYSLMITGNSMWTAPLIRPANYDAQKDFVPISLLSVQPTVVLVGPQSDVNSIEELVAKAKAAPGQLRYSAAGIGGTSHLSAELFKAIAGVDIEPIFYKSAADQQLAVMRGEVDMNIANASAAKGLIEQGELKALAVASPEPTQLMPDLPTVAASGVPGFSFESMSVMFAPAGTPDEIIRQVSDAVIKALTSDDTREKLFAAGTDVVASTPERLAEVMAADIERVAKVVEQAGLAKLE